MAGRTSSPTGESSAPLAPEEFAEAFEASSRLLWSIAAGVLGRRDGVEDVLQDAAMTGLGKLDDFERGTSFNAWMGRIVKLTALNHGRRRQRAERETAGGLPEIPDETCRADASIRPPADRFGRLEPDQSAFDDAVVAALHALEAPARACLLMRTAHGLSYREISAILEMPEGTAMSHVHRARRTLRDALESGEAGRAPGGREVPR